MWMLIVVREANAAKKDVVVPAAVTKKELPTRQGSGYGRMTLQEPLAASVAKSRTGSPKIVSEEGSTSGTPARSSSDLTRLESNGFTKENEPSSPTSEAPNRSASPAQIETTASDVKDPPSRTETPDIQEILADESIPPTP